MPKSRTKFFQHIPPAKAALIELVRHLAETEHLPAAEIAKRASIDTQRVYYFAKKYRFALGVQSKVLYTDAELAAVAREIASGKTYRQVALALHMRSSRVANICKKLDLSSQSPFAHTLNTALDRPVPFLEAERLANELAVLGPYEAADDAETPLVASTAEELAFASALAGASFSDVPLARKIIARHSGQVNFEHSSLIGCATGDLI